MEIGLNNKPNVSKIERYTIDSKIPENEEIKAITDYYLSKL
jgi:hypothetical protein